MQRQQASNINNIMDLSDFEERLAVGRYPWEEEWAWDRWQRFHPCAVAEDSGEVRSALVQQREPDTARFDMIVSGYSDAPDIIFLKDYGEKFVNSTAHYDPARDLVVMPEKDSRFSPIEYIDIFAHELAHSTGHYKRLNRIKAPFVNSEQYYQEELIAEFSSALIFQHLDWKITSRNGCMIRQYHRNFNDRDRTMTCYAEALESVGYLLKDRHLQVDFSRRWRRDMWVTERSQSAY
jgi:hypothetical protein